MLVLKSSSSTEKNRGFVGAATSASTVSKRRKTFRNLFRNELKKMRRTKHAACHRVADGVWPTMWRGHERGSGATLRLLRNAGTSSFSPVVSRAGNPHSSSSPILCGRSPLWWHQARWVYSWVGDVQSPRKSDL